MEEISRQMYENACEDREGLAKLSRELETAKDGAYAERNQCVALIARMVIEAGGMACKTRTAIEGWSEDWHGCVYIGLPTGQVSWHYHDSHAWMFKDLPEIDEKWDGHDTPEKYRRVNAAFAGDGEGKQT